MQTLHLKDFKKFNPLILSILAIGFFTSAIAFLNAQKNSSQQDLSAATISVQKQDWAIEIQANGVVKAIKKINLSPEESGRIDRLYVAEGDRVAEGQLIARMNNQQLQARVNQYRALLAKARANLAQLQAGTRPEEIARARAGVVSAKAAVRVARAKLDRASQEFKRYQTIALQGAISQNELNQYFTQHQEAKANLEAELARVNQEQESLQQAFNGPRPEEIAGAKAEVARVQAELAYYQIQLDKTILKAPFAGTITRRFAQEGDFVTPTTSASASAGATSASIAELSSGSEIEAKILEAKIGKIYLGQKVEIRADAYPDRIFQGEVNLIAPSAVKENNITSFKVKLAPRDGENLLKIGMNVKLTFLSNPVENALVIPLAAVVTNSAGETGVYIRDKNDRVRWQTIKVSEVSGQLVRVLEGLADREQILIDPPPGLKIEGVDTVGL